MIEESNKDRIMKLGGTIRAYRKSRNISQVELAGKINTQPNAIHRIEHGKVNSGINMIIKIADELDMKVRDLIEF